MAKETKGTKVKSFSIFVPRSGEEYDAEKLVVSVYFQGRDSEFVAWLPQHIADGVGNHPDKPDKVRGVEVRSKLAEDIEPTFQSMFRLYQKMQQNNLRKRVIAITISANHPRVNKYAIGLSEGYPAFDTISFAASPALAVSYDVLWQVGDGLYRSYKRDKDSDLDEMQYVRKADSSGPGRSKTNFLIDWTEDREALIASIHTGLTVLIERLWQLVSGDTAANVDRLIAGGGSLMLPAPQPTEEGS